MFTKNSQSSLNNEKGKILTSFFFLFCFFLKECVHALEKNWHPNCFVCSACKKPIGSGSFHIEEGQPYCLDDYRRMFQAKCTGCDFPIEPGDKYLEAMGGTYHAECFTCSVSCQEMLDVVFSIT